MMTAPMTIGDTSERGEMTTREATEVTDMSVDAQHPLSNDEETIQMKVDLLNGDEQKSTQARNIVGDHLHQGNEDDPLHKQDAEHHLLSTNGEGHRHQSDAEGTNRPAMTIIDQVVQIMILGHWPGITKALWFRRRYQTLTESAN